MKVIMFCIILFNYLLTQIRSSKKDFHKINCSINFQIIFCNLIIKKLKLMFSLNLEIRSNLSGFNLKILVSSSCLSRKWQEDILVCMNGFLNTWMNTKTKCIKKVKGEKWRRTLERSKIFYLHYFSYFVSKHKFKGFLIYISNMACKLT